MKIKISLRILSVFLAAAMLLSITACEKKAKLVTDKDRTAAQQSGSQEQQDETVSDGTQMAALSGEPLVAGNVVSSDLPYYSYISLDLPAPSEGKELQIIDFCVNEDKIVFLLCEYAMIDWSEIKEMEVAGIAHEEVEEEYTYHLAVYDFDGNAMRKINLNLANVMTDPSIYIRSMFINAWGEVSLLVISNQTGTSDVNQIFSFDEQGQPKDQVITLASLGENEIGYIMTLLGTGENLVALVRQFKDEISYETSYAMIAYNANGEELFRINTSDLAKAGEYIEFDEKIYSDGTFFYLREIYSRKIYKIDLTNQTLIPLSDNEYNIIMSGNGNLCVTDINGASFLDVNSGETTPLFSWKDLDFIGSYANCGIIILSEDRLLVRGDEYTNEPVKFSILKKEAVNPNLGKEIIRVGGIDVNYHQALQNAISIFNRNSNSYRAEVVEYRSDEYWETQEEYEAQYTAMNMQILAGDIPDIFIETGTYWNYISRYAAKNLFSDLYSFIEKDTTFQRSDYYENILTLPETNGQLPFIVPFYSLDGFLGKKEILNNRTGWTFSEFEAFANQLPPSMQLLRTANNLRLLENLTAGHMEVLVDYSSVPAKANFDSDLFRQILQFCNIHGRSISKEESMSIDEMSEFANNQLALVFDNAHIYSVREFTYPWSRANSPVTLVGYPSEVSSGPVCLPDLSAAIAASSPYQDAGWEFIKVLLSEELQKQFAAAKLWNSIPIHKDALDHACNQMISDSVSGISEGMSLATGGLEAQDAVDCFATLKEIVSSSNALSVYDRKILYIIEEESQAYFAGQKTMDDTISVIQSKVTTHLNEQ